MSDNMKSLLFAAALCLVCSLLLTAASTGFKPRQLRNIQTDMQKNILKSAGLLEPEKKYRSAEVDKLYKENIKCVYFNSEGEFAAGDSDPEENLHVFTYVKDNKNILAYILPVNARGLWGKINGYIALKNDGSTVSGFTVYKHVETPGLGAEIEKDWFLGNFTGKKILNSAGELVSVAVAKGKAEKGSETAVDGISGATLTGNLLSSGIKEVLEKYEPVSARFRKGELQEFEGDIPFCKEK